MTVDPLQGLNVSSENYDIHRVASVYYNSDGSMAWTKARFYDRDKAEPSVPVSVAQAWDFARGKINLNDWLARFYPKQMEVYNKVMSQTRERLLSL